MKTLVLPVSIKIKRGRIAAHKAMAYAALRADSSLKTRLTRYNNHMSKARALAGGESSTKAFRPAQSTKPVRLQEVSHE